MATIIRTANYIMSSVSNNNNKFWNAELYDDGTVVTKWGRIGDIGDQKTFPGAGDSFFDSKCREKSRKGYQLAQTLANTANLKKPLGNQAILATLDHTKYTPEISSFLKVIVDQNRHSILADTTLSYNESTGLFSTPLGIVTSNALDEAEKLLVKLQTAIGRFDPRLGGNSGIDSNLDGLRSQYLMLIPQVTPRKREDIQKYLTTMDELIKQQGIIDSLRASLISATTTPNASNPVENVFTFDIDTVADIAPFDKLFRSTLNAQHATRSFKMVRVFAVKHPAMQSKFEMVKDKYGNVRRLWHGTSTSNLLSILHKGFYIPKGNQVVNGSMFGVGAYFADQSTKSLNYAAGYWGGNRVKNCYMFLADVALGKMYTPQGSNRPYSYPVTGHHSTYAKAGISGVLNNEFVVYDTEQINPVYLCEFEDKR